MDALLEPENATFKLSRSEALQIIAALRQAVQFIEAAGGDASNTERIVAALSVKWQNQVGLPEGLSALVKPMPLSPTEAIDAGLDTLFEQKVALVHHEQNQQRLETGLVQCDDDWPGVFIRGDSALGYAMGIDNALYLIDEGVQNANALMLCTLCSLRNLLLSCSVDNNPSCQQVTQKVATNGQT